VARFVVVVEPGRLEAVLGALRAMGVRVVRVVQPYYVLVEAPQEMKQALEAVQGVSYVEVERVYRIALPVEAKLREFIRRGGPLNPLAMAWAAGFRKDRWPTSASRRVLGADVADSMGVTGRGVRVAVVDTGFDATPQKLRADFVYSTMELQPVGLDDNGHGVHVLTTIAGSRYPTPWGWLEGVAKGASVGAFKSLGYGLGFGSTVDVMEALIAAYGWGAKIVNLSLGSDIAPGESHDVERCPLCNLVAMLAERGVLVVVASGNSGVGYASCPAVSPGAVSVGALNKDLTATDFTSRGHPLYESMGKPEVSAPGAHIGSSTTGLIDVMEWVDGPRVAYISGTSMATPHISALLALWVEYARARGVELDREAVMDIIRSGAEAEGRSWSPDTGWGPPRFEWVVEHLRR